MRQPDDWLPHLIKGAKNMLKKSQEDYLEAILIQTNKVGACRVTDIAKQIGFTKASTSVALKKLEEDGYIYRDDWRVILTESGQKIAETTLERHNFFLEWFKMLGVKADIAEEDACRIEHVVSNETYECIRNFVCDKKSVLADTIKN